MTDTFARRHIGPSAGEKDYMLEQIGFSSMSDLVHSTVPANILTSEPLALEPARTESEALAHLRDMVSSNQVMKSYVSDQWSDFVSWLLLWL